MFRGLQCGNQDYKLQHIIIEDNGIPIQKTSDILLWVAMEMRRGILYTPISKLDVDSNSFIVPSQLLAAYDDRSRMLIKKTPNGTATIPFGGIILH